MLVAFCHYFNYFKDNLIDFFYILVFFYCTDGVFELIVMLKNEIIANEMLSRWRW